jgi:DNA-binding transcriptional LysR family regulator
MNGIAVIDVRRLRLLVELSRRGTIASVAQALDYSPSAVSQQLNVLEKEAGVRLLEPLGRRVRLTAEGELLVTHGEEVLAGLERAEAELAASRAQPTGRVRVAAFQSAVLSLVPGALLELERSHPSLRIEVTEMEPEAALPALAAGDFDVVLAEEYPTHPRPRLRGLDREDLMSDELCLVTPSTWRVRALADVADRPFAMEPTGSTSREWTESVCRSAGFEPDVRFTSTDLQVHLRMVEHGLAAAILPDLAGAGRHRRVRLHSLDGAPTRRIFTVTRSGARRRPAITALTAALLTSSTE